MLKALLILLISVCFLGCSYNFSDDNYIEIGEPNLEGSSIKLYSFNNGDVINIDKELSYEIITQPDQYGILTEIYIDNELFTSSLRTNSGTFRIRPSLYDDGEHTIRIIHVFNSGTGSIAAQRQRETITAIQDFFFIVDREPSAPPAITAMIENGSITLEWENNNNLEFVTAYLSLQFPGYQRRIPLTKEILAKGFYIDTSTVLFPLDANRRELEDRSVVTYSIVFVSEFEELIGQGATLEHDSSWIDVSMSFVDLEHFKVSWPQHPLYANFDSYNITVFKNFNHSYPVIPASTQGGEELVNAPYTFGLDYKIFLDPQTSSNENIPQYRSRPRLDEDTFSFIPNMQQYDCRDFIFNPSTQKYYLIAREKDVTGFNSGITIFEYSSDLEFLKKTVILELLNFRSGLRFNMVMDSESNNFYVDIRYFGENSEIIDTTMELDKSDLSKLKEFSEQSSEDSEFLQLRGNILKNSNSRTKTLTLTNIETDETFYSINKPEFNGLNISHISNDGKYIYLNLETGKAIYKINNNSLEKRVELVDHPLFNIPKRSYSIDVYEDILYYAASNSIKAINLNTSQERTFSHELGSSGSTVDYDPLSDRVLFIQETNCFVANLSSGQLSTFSYERNKNIGWLGDEYFMWLTNGKLTHSKGIYVDLQ